MRYAKVASIGMPSKSQYFPTAHTNMLPQVRLDRSRGTPLHQQLAAELRRLVLSRDLPPGARLPSTRRAAEELGVSRTLVVQAYEQLRAEGYFQAAVGVGTWVPESLAPHLLPPHKGGARERPREAQGRNSLSLRGARIASSRSAIAGTRPTFPLRPAGVAADEFPTRIWTRLTSKAWRSHAAELVHYGEVQGLAALRLALAEHLRRHRAVRVAPEQILITAGSQQSLDLIARLFLDVGDVAVVEEPGYDGATSVFRAAGARIVPAPVDVNGVDISSCMDVGHARLVYTTPSHQYPLGSTLSLERRLALLDWARRSDGWIVEDDYDSEFRYASRPLPSLQGLEQGARVLYVGTFSKVLAPALRIGFIVLPEDLVDPFVRVRQVTDHHPPLSIQATLAAFVAEGHLERHLIRMRGIYSARRDALIRALRTTFGEGYDIVAGDGGLHLTILIPDDLDDVAVAREAFARGLDPQPLSVHYAQSPQRQGLVLGFGAFPPDVLEQSVRVLRRCIDELRGRQAL